MSVTDDGLLEINRSHNRVLNLVCGQLAGTRALLDEALDLVADLRHRNTHLEAELRRERVAS